MKKSHFIASFFAAFSSLFSFFPPTQCKERIEVEKLRSYFETRSDTEMIARDFAAVGSDIAGAMRSLNEQQR